MDTQVFIELILVSFVLVSQITSLNGMVLPANGTAKLLTRATQRKRRVAKRLFRWFFVLLLPILAISRGKKRGKKSQE